jgi:hypothetical protein
VSRPRQHLLRTFARSFGCLLSRNGHVRREVNTLFDISPVIAVSDFCIEPIEPSLLQPAHKFEDTPSTARPVLTGRCQSVVAFCDAYQIVKRFDSGQLAVHLLESLAVLASDSVTCLIAPVCCRRMSS